MLWLDNSVALVLVLNLFDLLLWWFCCLNCGGGTAGCFVFIIYGLLTVDYCLRCFGMLLCVCFSLFD